jgi:hypothetical protein
MSQDRSIAGRITSLALVGFAVTTFILVAPGYFTSISATPPADGAFQVAKAFEVRARVFHEDGYFGRMDTEARFGGVIAFSCAGSSEARREFGWRGAREVMFDCPARFNDDLGREYAWVFRLVPANEDTVDASADGYRAIHIPAEDARALLTRAGLFP